jgi:hypothetical protein
MKYFSCLLVIFIFFNGCGEKTEEKPVDTKSLMTYDTSDVKTTAIDDPNQSFFLRYKFRKDKEYRYRIAALSENTQSIKFDTTISQKIKQNAIYILSLKPLEIEEDSTIEISCSFTSIKIDAQINGQSFSYQSGVTKDSLELMKYSLYESILNNPFTVRINKLGEILEVYRVDRIINKFLELSGNKDSVTTEDKNFLKQEIVHGSITPTLTQIFRKVPDIQVAKDSLWRYSQPAASLPPFQIQNTNIYKIAALEKMEDDKIALLEASLETKISGKTEFTEQGISFEYKKPITEATGKVYFNVTGGYIQKSKTRTRLDISHTREANTMRGKQKGTWSEITENSNIIEML